MSRSNDFATYKATFMELDKELVVDHMGYWRDRALRAEGHLSIALPAVAQWAERATTLDDVALQAYDKITADSWYENDVGDRYCVSCHLLLSGGPHSPNPHDDDCPYRALWGDEHRLEGPNGE